MDNRQNSQQQTSSVLKEKRQNQSVDFVDRCSISIQDIIKSNMRQTTGDSVFGISGYHLPNTNIITQRPRTTKFTTYNVPHFIDKYTKSREFVPGPKYDTMQDWKNNLKARGQFSKSPRVTFTETVIKESKWLEHPGPGAYKHFDGFKKNKHDKVNVALRDKFCEFIEEAKFVGTETPAPKYDLNYTRIDSDLKYARIKPSKVSRMDKIQKDPKKPAPGDYNTIDAYNKTQTIQHIHKIGQSKNSCFVDQYQKAKQFLPGIGAYKVEPKVYNILSKSPVSIRTLRH
eukprot:403361797